MSWVKTPAFYLLVTSCIYDLSHSARGDMSDVIVDDRVYSNKAIVLDTNIITFFAEAKLTWNDAQSVCQSSVTGGSLVQILTDKQLNSFAYHGPRLKFTPIWIGLVRFGNDDNVLWTNCQGYNSSAYSTTFENIDDTSSSNARCAVMNSSIIWEWRHCGEFHGFACVSTGFEESSSIDKKFFPMCQQETRSACPKTECKKETECLISEQPLNGWASQFDDVKVTWLEAWKTCVLSGSDIVNHVTVIENKMHAGWFGYMRIGKDRYLHPADICIVQHGSFMYPIQPIGSVPGDLYPACSFLNGTHMYWRDCGERHSVICQERGIQINEKGIQWNETGLCTDELYSQCKIESMRHCYHVQEHSRTGFCLNEFEPAISQSTTEDAVTEISSPSSIETTSPYSSTDFEEETDTNPDTEAPITTTDPTTTEQLEELTTPNKVTTERTTEQTTHDTTTLSEPLLTTETPNIFSCNTSCLCRCKCVKTVFVSLENWTLLQERKDRWITALLDELTPNQSFSSKRRRFESAKDTRESATTIGSLGVFILLSVVLCILLLDLSSLVTELSMFKRTLTRLFK